MMAEQRVGWEASPTKWAEYLVLPICSNSGLAHPETEVAIARLFTGGRTLLLCKSCLAWAKENMDVRVRPSRNARTDVIVPMPCTTRYKRKTKAAFTGLTPGKKHRRPKVDYEKLLEQLDSL